MADRDELLALYFRAVVPTTPFKIIDFIRLALRGACIIKEIINASKPNLLLRRNLE